VALEQDARLSDRIPVRAEPMLATLVDRPFHRPGWVYEEKYDGYRVLAYKEGPRTTLRSRSGKDCTDRWPEIAAAVASLPARTLLLDGEVVAFDERLVSRFQLLQRGAGPFVYMVFDCLWRDGEDLRERPLAVRRAALEDAVRGVPHLFPARRLARDGLAAFRTARERGYEGLVAKDRTAPYVAGRSTRWCKVKVFQEEELVIGGYTAPGGTRSHFGALLVGAYDAGGKLRYAGRVGTGFDRATLAALHRTFQPLMRDTAPFADPPRLAGVTWLAPRLVAQVAFLEWTDDGRLRAPVFLGLRDDKEPRECRLPA
jgi:DNA ligase D-like protein (predicted ligase)